VPCSSFSLILHFLHLENPKSVAISNSNFQPNSIHCSHAWEIDYWCPMTEAHDTWCVILSLHFRLGLFLYIQNNFCEYFNTLCLARPKFVHEVLRELDSKYVRRGNVTARFFVILCSIIVCVFIYACIWLFILKYKFLGFVLEGHFGLLVSKGKLVILVDD